MCEASMRVYKGLRTSFQLNPLPRNYLNLINFLFDIGVPITLYDGMTRRSIIIDADEYAWRHWENAL